MPRRKSGTVKNRAWNVLRLALLWSRKGGVFKRRLLMELRILPKYLKSLAHGNGNRDMIRYGERELSFDDTPIFHVKMHRPASLRFRLPHIPCINPEVDFDYDFDMGEDGDDHGICYEKDEERVPDCDEDSIDMKAEEFIAKFYEQMKLQRQISYLEYK